MGATEDTAYDILTTLKSIDKHLVELIKLEKEHK